jgi:hypothetical protein
MKILNFFKKKPKPEFDKMKVFFTANPGSEHPINFYIEGSEIKDKPSFPKDRIEIH